MTEKKSYWLHISSGKGPDECAYFVGKLADLILKDAQNNNVSGEIIKSVSGERKNTFLSILISLQLPENYNTLEVEQFINSWRGTIQWICPSPFRPHHKRKNWFVGVDILTPPEDNPNFSNRDVKFTTMRSSGAGGQNVNKLETAVRATHLPTGVNVTASEERSQYLNKKLAVAKLAMILACQEKEQIQKLEEEFWLIHQNLERGNPIRTYQGKNFIIR